VIQNYYDAVELLLSNGAKVNHMTTDKFSPLHAAVRSQFGDIAALLLRHGADFNLADGKGRTPLQIAQRYANYARFARLPSYVCGYLELE
jgi:ankyrin repeat protein